jgi:hypothetical protein
MPRMKGGKINKKIIDKIFQFFFEIASKFSTKCSKKFFFPNFLSFFHFIYQKIFISQGQYNKTCHNSNLKDAALG